VELYYYTTGVKVIVTCLLSMQYSQPPLPSQELIDTIDSALLEIANPYGSDYLSSLERSLALALQLPYSDRRTELLKTLYIRLAKDDTTASDKAERANFDDLYRQYKR